MNGTTASNGEAVPPENKFNGGSNGSADGGVDGYFVGLIDSIAFDEAVVSSYFDSVLAPRGAFQFRVDDLYTAQAPVPPSLALLALGAGLLGLRHQRSRRAPV
ncbi:PEP-CTERM sorting domain-containing protein [uncultured Thiohalocapsa sp.]|uniref:PEP-CTERM sorting domain-containing protein n=1 Tax=uncultured Thiohalocapsa sp. TaxID=768990 RepID=UPI0025E401A2|nr:PEP-CTERM sorting domain-containing protein [uncultured Thiohalocapsa sp.]